MTVVFSHLSIVHISTLFSLILPFIGFALLPVVMANKTTTAKFDGRHVIEVNFRLFGPVYNEQHQKYQNCGGTLISDKHILTAAHCFFDPEKVCQKDYAGKLAESFARDEISVDPARKDKFSLEYAVVDLDGLCLPNKFCKLERCACLPPNGTREIGVNRVFIPASFVHTHCALGDIAVVELATEVAPRRVQLARSNTPIRHPLYASGYGYNPTIELPLNPDVLMTANVSVLNECPEGHKEADAICADEVELNQNVCQGDSGAGLRDLDGNIFGIVAYGTKCDVMANDDQQKISKESQRAPEVPFCPKSTFPERNYEGAVYTNVTFYLPFICGIVGAEKTKGCLLEDVEKAKQQPHFEIAKDGGINGTVADFKADCETVDCAP